MYLSISSIGFLVVSFGVRESREAVLLEGVCCLHLFTHIALVPRKRAKAVGELSCRCTTEEGLYSHRLIVSWKMLQADFCFHNSSHSLRRPFAGERQGSGLAARSWKGEGFAMRVDKQNHWLCESVQVAKNTSIGFYWSVWSVEIEVSIETISL